MSALVAMGAKAMPFTGRRGQETRVRTAVYLRCHPYDTWQTGPHYRAVLQHARNLSLPAPDVFFDNGCLSRGPLPQLERLLGAVENGHYDVVLLPGPFVLSLDDDKAQDIVRRIRAHGCRIEELPSLREHVRARAHAVAG